MSVVDAIQVKPTEIQSHRLRSLLVNCNYYLFVNISIADHDNDCANKLTRIQVIAIKSVESEREMKKTFVRKRIE